MNLTKRICKRFNFLTDSYGFLREQKPMSAICFHNDKISIVLEYDYYKHEYFDLSVTECGKEVMKTVYGNVYWNDENFIDEKLSRRLENAFARRRQLITLSENKLDELIEIYADYIENNICGVLKK